jgi:LPXTG-motif cell wall-anchored protein
VIAPLRRLLPLLLAGGACVGLVVAETIPAGAVGAPVGLGTATSYSVLAGSAVTSTGATTLGGDLGVSPGSSITGFPPGVASGTTHAADAAAAQAQADATTAYDDAAGRGPATAIAADLGGQTLVSGVYAGGAVGLTGTLTLDAQGDPSAVFVFQTASTLITASSSVVSLIGGARACNVYWKVGSSATLGTGSSFVGTILALTSITVTTGSTVDGRLLARNGAVTLDAATVDHSCTVAPSATTTTSTTTSTSTSTTSTTSATSTTSTTGVTTLTTPAVDDTNTATGAPVTTPAPTLAGDATASPTPTEIGGGSSIDTIGLPRTGVETSTITWIGILTMLVGLSLVAAARRKSTHPAH